MISTITQFLMARNQWCVNQVLALIDKNRETNFAVSHGFKYSAYLCDRFI